MVEVRLARTQARSALIGKPQDRIDGVAKGTGAAKYTYDINPDKMLMARALGCPHAHCKIKSIDTSAPPRRCRAWSTCSPMKKAGDEIHWQGDLVACVVGETEGAVAEGPGRHQGRVRAARRVRQREDLAAAEAAGRTGKGGGKVQLENEAGDGDDEDELRGEGDRAAVQGSRPPSSKATTASTSSRTCAWSRTARPASGTTAS